MDTELKKRINKWLKDPFKKNLKINDLGLKEWPDILKGKEDLIIKLDCSDNELTFLPIFSKLTFLDCSFTDIDDIPVLPNLNILRCANTLLKSLPVLPNLTKLYCWDVLIENIPVFPKLTKLCCSNNRLKSIPVLPNLTILKCWHNPIKSIPFLPKLTRLNCSHTQLFSDKLDDWKKIWKIQNLRKLELRMLGLRKVLKIMKKRLYLPRLHNLHKELIYSPNHPGKFYKNLRIGDWSFEKLQNLNK